MSQCSEDIMQTSQNSMKTRIFIYLCIIYAANEAFGDWVEIPHFTKNSYSYPLAPKTIFTTPSTTTRRPTFATTATKPTYKKRTIPKEKFNDVLERPPLKNATVNANNNQRLIKNRNQQPTNNLKSPNSRNKVANNNIKTKINSTRRHFEVHTPAPTTSNPLKKIINDNLSHMNSFQEGGNYEEDFEEDSDEIDEEFDEEVDEESNEKANGNEGFSYARFLPYLQSIQSTLMRTNHKSTKSKILVLQDLRDTLLYNLKEKIDNLWRPKREKRGASEHKDDYHMDFSSNEGPLMTIGFLTFAVFLIKLVLKLINALKAKQSMIMIPTATTTQASMLMGRRKRSELLDSKAAEILSLIDQYKFA